VVGVADNTHVAADATDFVGGVFPSGTVTFLDGETSKLIYIPVAGDNTIETNERFEVILSNPVNATIDIGMDYGYIINDDYPIPELNILPIDNVKSEGSSGTTLFEFVVNRSNGYEASSVDYSVVGATDGTHSHLTNYLNKYLFQ
jgi:hypothetical protein